MKQLNKAEKLKRHMLNVAKIIGVSDEEIKPIYHQLKVLEYQGHKASEDYCNLANFDIDKVINEIRPKIEALIKNKEVLRNIKLNFDPRGYFLKIDDDYVRKFDLDIERDWGGYGIICPIID